MHIFLTYLTMFLLESSVTGCLRTENMYMLIGRQMEVELKLQLVANTVSNLETRNNELSMKDNEKQQTIKLLENKTEYLTSLAVGLNSTVLQLSTANAVLNKTVSSQQLLIAGLENGNSNESMEGIGSTYVRWGRTTCPGNGSDIVYKGYVGGSKHNVGNAANYLCLPEDPQWKAYDVTRVYGSKLYGAEYQAHNGDLTAFLDQNINLADKNPVCVVCSTARSRVLMIPGKTSCYDGWTEEYDGYLASGRGDHKASEFVCLDDNAEYRAGSEQDENGRLFYLVQAVCGSLPCPPYIEGRQVTCVVCSK